MPRPMRSYTVTAEDKRATLHLAGWQEVAGRWWPPGAELVGLGLALDSAYRTWRAG